MGTNCKLIIGYTDHMGWWIPQETYYRHYDGYSEAVLPALKEFTSAENGVDIPALNESMEYDSHKFELVEETFGMGNCNYHYLIDDSNRGKIKCTVLKNDLEFYKKYCVDNMRVEQELVLWGTGFN